ncbi:Fur family transcriptional regulator [Sporomusa sp. GT1]|uniref:Fur family transcriptional regulator n=1 Tax=Sporomusa sp. GT1 TaxID=1534747 RepID=UPI001662C87D|nr:Fur family transcriptional regulator [Sporomusa sp. GT1]
MMQRNNPFVQELLKRNITPSHQRVMILQYLVENRCHPTVEQIFSALRSSIPTLSKATVYNTLNIFLEAHLVRILSVEENETRYDIVMENHGHFKCSSCGSIYNFAVNIDQFVTEELRGFQIAEKNVYFHGICPNCIVKIEK